MDETSITSVGDFVDQIISFTKSVQRRGQSRHWFTGQSEFDPDFSETVLGRCLMESHCFEPGFTRPVSARSADWTSDALVALYFAVEDDRSSKRGAVFALDALAFQMLQRGDLDSNFHPLKKLIVESSLKSSVKADLYQLGIDHVSVYADVYLL